MSGLTADQIANLTRRADQAEVSKKHKSRWLTPSDARALLTALTHDADEVALGGKMFSINHHGSDRFFVRPVEPYQYVPCGWYNTSLLKSIASQDEHS